MKNCLFLFPICALLATDASGAELHVQSEPTVVARGPHSRVWQRTTAETLSNGRVRTNRTSFVELGSGLHRWDEQTGAWVDAEDTIQVVNGIGVATRSAHQLIFSANANTAGSIDLLTPDNKRLRSHCVGLAFFEPRTGRSEMFAALKDSVGELHPPNTVIYPDAFDGVKADLVYINRIGSFEQNVVLKENRALPDGWQAAETIIECWTEFLQPPQSAGAQRARAGMIDDTLDFGAMQTSVGRAFALGEENAKSSAVVVKRWLVAEGRTFLVEQVRYVDVKAQLVHCNIEF